MGFRGEGKRHAPDLGVLFCFLSFLTTFFFALFLIFIFFFFVTETFERNYSLHYYITTYIALHCIANEVRMSGAKKSFFLFLVPGFDFFCFVFLLE